MKSANKLPLKLPLATKKKQLANQQHSLGFPARNDHDILKHKSIPQQNVRTEEATYIETSLLPPPPVDVASHTQQIDLDQYLNV